MAENKTSFLLYTDVHYTVAKLTDEQAGKLFKHILSYVNDENPVIEDLILQIAFEPIKQSLKRDLKRYEAICLRNRENGQKGGRPKKKPKKPSGLIGNPNNPIGADSDSDSDNDSGIDKDNEIMNIFNTTRFPKIQKLSDSRKKHLQARIKEYGADKVKEIFMKADKSDFLCGINNNGWKANFDWLINPNNFVKVMEGNYDNKPRMLA